MLASRRQVLAGAAVALASACTVRRAPRQPPRNAAPSPVPDPLAAAAARERTLLAAYDDALGQHPDLAPLLSPYREDHAAHLHALEPGAVVSATVTPSPRRTSRRDRAKVRKRLRLLEERAARHHARDAISAPVAHAPLLASLAGCEAAHAELLT